MQSVCVFCASSPGRPPQFTTAMEELAAEFVKRNMRVVYGGARVGLMAVLADATLRLGGEVIGVMPKQLMDYEIAHGGLTELHVVNSMAERKALMAELSDAFIAAPGGLGTLDEFTEMLTWSSLDFHAKPSGLLNTLGFYDPLLTFFDRAVDDMVMKKESRDFILRSDSPAELLDQMANWKPTQINKWMDAEGNNLFKGHA